MNFEVPLDLGAKGSCFIGGNIATNAGGKYFVKHGAFKSYILGLEVVRADGSVLNMLSGMKKDNTGFDLKQLFIGSEGTLGVITKAAIKCVSKSKSTCLVVCKTDDYSKVLKAIEQSQSIGKALGALEYMDGYTYQLVLKHVLNNQSKISCAPQQYLLFIELCSDGDQPPVELLFQNGFNQHFTQIIASQSKAEYNYFWKIRQEAAVASTAEGYCYKYDVSLPIQFWKQLCDKIRSWDFGFTIGYGHAGDSNIHINIVTKTQHPNASHFEKLIFQEVVRVGGSISAEHGMGQQKPDFLRLQKSREEVQLMKGVKQLLDPRGILNPYKVLPE